MLISVTFEKEASKYDHVNVEIEDLVKGIDVELLVKEKVAEHLGVKMSDVTIGHWFEKSEKRTQLKQYKLIDFTELNRETLADILNEMTWDDIESYESGGVLSLEVNIRKNKDALKKVLIDLEKYKLETDRRFSTSYANSLDFNYLIELINEDGKDSLIHDKERNTLAWTKRANVY